jgi:hypothetical protein
MAKKTISFNDNQIIITDDKNKSEKLDLLDMLPDTDAILAIRKEQKAGTVASVGALSLLAHMLNNPRFDAYKGQTPINEKITPEFRGALRDIEIEYMKPLFTANLQNKGNSAATIEKQWQEYSLGLRTGTYALVKSYVSKLFCHLGQLPLAENGKLLPINAIKTILANAETPKESQGLAGKLVAILTEIETKGDKVDMGDLPTALAALHRLTQYYRHAENEQAEKLTEQGGIFAKTEQVINDAMSKPVIITDDMLLVETNPETIAAWYENGQITAEQSETWADIHGYAINDE